MPLIPQYGCDPIAPPDDCGWLYDQGMTILEGALDGLAPYLPATGSPCGDSFRSYVSLGPPPADTCDILGVWLAEYRPMAGSLNQGIVTPGIPVQYATEWQVDLWEKCYPGPTEVEGTFHLPDPEVLGEINEWVYQHGLAIYHGVIDKLRALPCQSLIVAALRPLEPRGGCGGWTFRVAMA